MPEVPQKETKAQRTERLKLEKNPWEAFDEVRAFARDGRSSVLPEWASLYFKWWGIYTQGDGVGATGGKGGEGLATDYFMMRIGIPNGIVSASQLRVIGGLTRKHARNLADITVRQNIQLHWLTIESLPEIVDALDAIGLSPKGACGDVVRNVTGCPLAGVAADELIDASPLALEIAHLLTGQPRFLQPAAQIQNLRHRLPVLVHLSGDQRHWPHAGASATAKSATRCASAAASPTSRILPFASTPSSCPIRPCAAVRAVTEIFRDQQGLRESRERARLKYLFMKEGWTAESFLAELQSRARLHAAARRARGRSPTTFFRDHVGIHPQRQPGLSYVGASVLRGRMTGEQLEAAAELAERFGSGALRATVSQNLLFIDIPNAQNRRTGARTGPDRPARRRLRPSGAAPSPAPAPSSASWPSLRPRASPAGWSTNSKSACRDSTSSSSCT